MANDFQPCPNRTENKKPCTCAYAGCSRHGVCCQCVTHHRSRGELPQCLVKAGL
ncbi:MAG: DUF6485 family protein [Planctomycetota bacterium]|jgi:hypothetical protein|nr:DUF6485 family protein [Planctomycetota bacterium]